jgi:hypothetical protein
LPFAFAKAKEKQGLRHRQKKKSSTKVAFTVSLLKTNQGIAPLRLRVTQKEKQLLGRPWTADPKKGKS